MTDKTIEINVPVLARVEGEGALDLKITNGHIDELCLRIYEPPRYFEKFLEGRSYDDILDTVARICGICPVAYQMSAVHAIESIFGAEITPWIREMRRVMYCGEWLQSHSLHIHMLAVPDFLGFNSVIEMAEQYPNEVKRGLKLQTLGNNLISLFGGRSVHPVGVKAGGFYKAPNDKKVRTILEQLQDALKDAEALVKWTASLELPDDEQAFVSVAMRNETEYPLNEGRIVSDQGLDISIDEYENHFQELHVPQSTALHSLLHDKLYLVGPLARINLNHDQLPQPTLELIKQTGIQFPSRNMFHSIIARAIEIHYVIYESLRILEDYSQPDSPYVEVNYKAGKGFGCTEAPRGLLWHSYEIDDNGLVKSSRIVPPTSQNQARIEEDLRNSLETYGLDNLEDDLRLHAEKVIRNYDPCISCATHFLDLKVEQQSFELAKDIAGHEKIKQNVRVNIIGIGSPFGNDQMGWEVVKQIHLELGKQESVNNRVAAFVLDRPGTALLEHFKGVDKVILIDALTGTQEAGLIIKIEPDDIANDNSNISSHDIGVRDALMLASKLDLDPEIIIFGLALGNETKDIIDREQITLFARKILKESGIDV
jgi:hydrogenase maturation protease